MGERIALYEFEGIDAVVVDVDDLTAYIFDPEHELRRKPAPGEVVDLVYSGDGRLSGKRLPFVMFTLKILLGDSEEDVVRHTYTIGVWRGKESELTSIDANLLVAADGSDEDVEGGDEEEEDGADLSLSSPLESVLSKLLPQLRRLQETGIRAGNRARNPCRVIEITDKVPHAPASASAQS